MHAEDDSINSLVPMWAVDLKNSESNAKKFFLQGIDPFLADHARVGRQNRIFYEVIHPNYPCKLFFDIDISKEAFGELFARYVGCMSQFDDAFMKCVNRSLSRELNIGESRPFILDSSTDSKLSRHYVWPLLFKNIYHVKAFVYRTLHDITSELQLPEKKVIDTNVYAKFRNFRICHSTKVGKNSHLRLISHRDFADDAAEIRATLVQAYATSDFSHVVVDSNAVENLQKPSSTNHAKRPRMAEAPVPGEVESIQKELTARGIIPADVGIYVDSKDKNKVYFTYHGHCQLAGRTHKSNNVKLVFFQDTKHGYFTCMDSECSGIWGKACYALDPIAFEISYMKFHECHLTAVSDDATRYTFRSAGHVKVVCPCKGPHDIVLVKRKQQPWLTCMRCGRERRLIEEEAKAYMKEALIL